MKWQSTINIDWCVPCIAGHCKRVYFSVHVSRTHTYLHTYTSYIQTHMHLHLYCTYTCIICLYSHTYSYIYLNSLQTNECTVFVDKFIVFCPRGKTNDSSTTSHTTWHGYYYCKNILINIVIALFQKQVNTGHCYLATNHPLLWWVTSTCLCVL